jgi:hypothetical protein
VPNTGKSDEIILNLRIGLEYEKKIIVRNTLRRINYPRGSSSTREIYQREAGREVGKFLKEECRKAKENRVRQE